MKENDFPKYLTTFLSLYLPGQDPLLLWKLPDVSGLKQEDLYLSTNVAECIVDIMEGAFV